MGSSISTGWCDTLGPCIVFFGIQSTQDDGCYFLKTLIFQDDGWYRFGPQVLFD